MTRQLYKKIGSKFLPLGRYDSPGWPVNGWMYVSEAGDGFCHIHMPEWVKSPIKYAELHCIKKWGRVRDLDLVGNPDRCNILLKEICDEIYSRHYELKSKKSIDYSGYKREGYDFTVYRKTSRKYEIFGPDGGFNGFHSPGIWYVNIMDGIKREEGATLIEHARTIDPMNVYKLLSGGSRDLFISKISRKLKELDLSCYSTYEIYCLILLEIYKIAYKDEESQEVAK